MKTCIFSPNAKNTLRLFFAGIATFLCLTTSAQTLDSLKTVLVEYHNNDTTRVNIMLEMTNQYRDISPDSTKTVAQRALAIAEKNNFPMGIGRSLYMIGVAYAMANQYDSSLNYYEQALRVFHKAGLTDKECMTWYNINVSYYRMRKNDKALEALRKDSAIAEQYNYYARKGRAMLAMGDIYRDMGEYADAVSYYLKSLTLHEKIKDTAGQSEAYRNTADIYALVGNQSKAIEYITKANALYKPKGNIQGVLVNYTSVAAVYGQIHDNKNSLAYYKKALHIADSVHIHYWIGSCLINIGENELALGNADSALQYYEAGIRECAITHDAVGAAFANKGVGSILAKKGQTKEAITYLQSALAVMKDAGLKKEIADISKALSSAYDATGNCAEALSYLKISQQNYDTLYGENNDKRMQEIQFDYELKKQEAEILLLQKDNVIRQARLEKQKATSIGLISGVVLLIAVVCLLYVSRQREKRNKEKSMRQATEIQQQATALEELNQYKDKTFSVLSHDLRGPLTSFAGAMAMLDDDETSHEEFVTMKPEINKQLSSLNLLLDNLLNWSKSHMQGEKAMTISVVDINQLAKDNIALAETAAAKKIITIHNNIPDHIFATADKGQIDIVIRNLLNNAIKFTGERGRITLAAKQEGNNIAISIADTGVGMSQQQLHKLFKVVTNNSTYGTGGEKGIGLGLLLCYEFIKANKGTITATSEPGKGSTFIITLPAGEV